MAFKQSIEQRFWNHVSKGSEDECWEWQGSRYKDGYGQFHVPAIGHVAHRVAYVLFVEEIDTDDLVLHKCDNPPCVNPNHLYKGDASQNANDRFERKPGIIVRGSLNGMSKLTEGEVLDIKMKLAENIKPRVIAEMYEISPKTVSDIRTGRYWKHVIYVP